MMNQIRVLPYVVSLGLLVSLAGYSEGSMALAHQYPLRQLQEAQRGN